MTIPEIIDLLGGPTPVGAAIEVPPTTVGNWKARNSIPARHHAAIIRFSNGKITADMLVRAHEKSTAVAA